jgi:hypothetical protein
MRADETMRWPAYARAGLGLCLALGALILAGAPARPQGKGDAGEIRGLKLGLKTQSMTTDGFDEFACGSNGGPPRQKLEGWSGFAKCAPEPSGLREVQVRFDDELEYVGKAIADERYTDQQGSTRVAGHPVILSVLFDEGGTLRALRFISDPRGTALERRMAHMLRLAVIDRYGPAAWSCTDFPPADGETPVGGVFLKQRCEKLTAERDLSLEAHFLRKPGQNAIDPKTHEYTSGQFESWTRFEIYDPAFRKR